MKELEELYKRVNKEIKLILGLSNNNHNSLPTDIEMDEKILKIMDENLVGGTVAENTEGIICNKFATSLKIVRYIKELMENSKL
jgi:hypothetical protein